MNRQIGDRAVVLGAGMAGLLAARVLAEGYGQVTVIDRDELPDTAMHRRGVPTAATCMRWRRAGSRPWRSCSPS
jgi:glycine/D-amino acid oxidase-like deaminating enzyme